jgi:hypothetical protein
MERREVKAIEQERVSVCASGFSAEHKKEHDVTTIVVRVLYIV